MINKNRIGLLIGAAVLVLLLAGAYVTYKKLSSDYIPKSGDTETVEAIDFTVTDRSGGDVKLSDFAGKPVVVNFWASWCPPCVEELGYFNDAYQEFGGDVQFMMVNVLSRGETPESSSEFVDGKEYTFPVFFDTYAGASSAYQISSIPMTIFINGEGNIVTGYIGGIKYENIVDGIEQAGG